MSKKAAADTIKEELKLLKAEQDVATDIDEEFDPSTIRTGRLGAPHLGDRQLANDEKVIDELLTSVPQNQGYYLKLYKEVRPNEYELKKRIDNYDSWTDLEWEINSIVRSYTTKQPDKWGSGRYRIVIWKDGGLRGPKHKPIDFLVDAQELLNPNPNNQSNSSGLGDVKEQLGTLSELVKSFSAMNPQVSPAETQKLLSESFQLGLGAKGAASSESNSLTAALIAMMSEQMKSSRSDPTLIALLTELTRTTQKDPLASLKSLKEAGLLGDDKKSSVSQLTELAQLMEVIQDLKGGGSSSTAGEIVKALSPHIGEAIGLLREGVQAFQGLKNRKAIQGAPQIPTQTVPTANPKLSEPNIPDHPLLKEIYTAVEKNDHNYFPKLVHGIGYWVENGDQYLQAAIEGVLSPDQVQSFLVDMGGEYFRQGKVKAYMTSFIDWYKNQINGVINPPLVASNLTPTDSNITPEQEAFEKQMMIDEQFSNSHNLIRAICPKCNEAYDFENQDAWDHDSKICDSINSLGAICGGKIIMESELAKGSA